MELKKEQADFILNWLFWAMEETADSELWTIKDDELYEQIRFQYRKQYRKQKVGA